ncbi:nose resistant to fluoxetine protein 6-like [Zophobas morio]|uniref:nose resistant to fluoxetine protein 6-like n=1 Tax=Zophobas morio TaxID=2755281 RepID=UPI003082C73E
MLRVVLVVILVGAQCRAQKSFFKALGDVGLDLTPKCQEQVEELVANFGLDESSWALQMVDATSKVPSGLLNYNFGEMGDFQECVGTQGSGDIVGKYCLGYLSFPNGTFNASGVGTGSMVSAAPAWALCLPSGCTTEDMNVVGNAVLSQLLQDLDVRVDFSDLLCQTMDDVDPKLTAGAIAAIVVLVLLGTTVLVSTLYDIYSTFYVNQSSPMIIKGFSVYTNGQKIFKMTTPTADQLPCLNGLKFISMMWVVAGHQFSIPMYGSLTNTKYLIQWADHLYSMFLISGTLSVDTFFTVGGALMSYGFMKAMHKKVPFNLFLYYLHRYLRLTAPFALVVLFSATLLKYMGSGPKWPLISLYFQQNCQDYWWSALLYVQNYVNVSNMCVGQTWYLNIDMQLYIVSPVVLFGLWKYPKFCLPILGLCSLVFMGVSFYEAWDNDLPAILSNLYTTHATDYQNEYYLLTHTRATPWVVGVVLGFFLFKIKQKEITLELNQWVVLVAWGACFATLLACVLGGHSTLRSPEYDRWGNVLHITLVRPLWSVAIAWIILACCNDYGGPVNWILSLPIFQVLNRFTYGIYLTHVTFLYVIAYGRHWPDYFGGFNMAYQFWGTLWFSTGLAALLVFMTESPMIVVEKILLGNFGKKKKSSPKADPERGVDNAAYER